MPPELTKKQQKAAAFKAANKGEKPKKPAPAEPSALPEEDPVVEVGNDHLGQDGGTQNADDMQQGSNEKKEKSKSKKLKEKKFKERLEREKLEGKVAKVTVPDGITKTSKANDSNDVIVDATTAKVTVTPKVKDATEAEMEGKEGEAEGSEKKSRKGIKQKFILFVGQLSYTTMNERIAQFFEAECGEKPSVRLLTTKATPANAFHRATPAKSRGMAFIEFTKSSALQLALKLHHTELDGKRINVELTAGGGGTTEVRKRKIDERNERIGVQRTKKAEEEGEAGAGDGAIDETENGGGEEGPDKKKSKVRGGRRGKKEDGPTAENATPEALPGWQARASGTFASQPPAQRGGPPMRGGRGGQRGGAGGQFGGPGRGRGGGNGGGGGGGGAKWQPTGTNATPVG